MWGGSDLQVHRLRNYTVLYYCVQDKGSNLPDQAVTLQELVLKNSHSYCGEKNHAIDFNYGNQNLCHGWSSTTPSRTKVSSCHKMVTTTTCRLSI